MEKLIEVVEENGNISTYAYRDKHYPLNIIVSPKDKYGQAMIAYFYNMLSGNNISGTMVKGTKLYYDNQRESYVLQAKANITAKDLQHQYAHIRKNYNVLIQDEISHLDKILGGNQNEME